MGGGAARNTDLISLTHSLIHPLTRPLARTGHIPVSSSTKAPAHAPRDPQEKGNLVLENYTPYTG